MHINLGGFLWRPRPEGGHRLVLQTEGGKKTLLGKTRSKSWTSATVKALKRAGGDERGGSLRDEKGTLVIQESAC